MSLEQHYRSLESMYAAAPINRIYQPEMTVSEGVAEITIEVNDTYHHSAGAVHGSVYFKMLDDAAFFAANSLETETFVLTSSFTTYFTRPIVLGKMRAVGKVVHQSKTQFIVEAIAYNSEGKEIARGNGVFVRGRHRLVDALGYKN